jgi:hypothetical protein
MLVTMPIAFARRPAGPHRRPGRSQNNGAILSRNVAGSADRNALCRRRSRHIAQLILAQDITFEALGINSCELSSPSGCPIPLPGSRQLVCGRHEQLVDTEYFQTGEDCGRVGRAKYRRRVLDERFAGSIRPDGCRAAHPDLTVLLGAGILRTARQSH